VVNENEYDINNARHAKQLIERWKKIKISKGILLVNSNIVHADLKYHEP